jgi:hypothetical protein
MNFTIPACCADAQTNHCGLDSSVLSAFGPTFTEACQPLAQPGELDPLCPASPATPVQGSGLTITFPGCCRPNHSCGYDLDKLAGLFTIGLGCVDSAPFLNGAAPQACGESAGAAGTEGGAGAAGSAAAAGSSGVAGESAGGAAGEAAGGVAGT